MDVDEGCQCDTPTANSQEGLEIRCIRAIRAWKDGGYLGEALNDTDSVEGVSVEEISPDTSGFVKWTRLTGNAAAYRDIDGTERGTAVLATPHDSTEPPERVLLYLHGGGYRKYKPSDGYVLAIATRLAKACSSPLLAIDYRLAPEFDVASRAAVHDVLDATNWLKKRFQHSQVFTVGDSAGAGLALSSALACLEQRSASMTADESALLPPTQLPAGIVILSPYIDLTMTSTGFEASMFRYDDAFGDIFYTNHCGTACASSDREWLRSRAKDYIRDSDCYDPYCSPVYMSDSMLREFPPVLALVGGHEIYLQETSVFAKRAQALGVNCSLHVVARMWHDWFNFCHLPAKIGGSQAQLPAALDAYITISSWLRNFHQ